jgi:release factor glutamine methyltransferase
MQNQNRIWTIIDIILWTASYFESKSIESPRSAAEILLSHALNMERVELYINHDKPLKKNELSLFKKLIKRRINREPVFYITGFKEFWSLKLHVTKDVLIPRPETEILVEEALKIIPDDCSSDFNILELGVGSGAIIISLAHEKKNASFFATDISFQSIKIAKKNALTYNLENKILFFISNWFDAFSAANFHEKLDIIVSNPPYIPTNEINKLEHEIKRHEPLKALDGGDDGLLCIKNIILNARLYLKKGGSLLLEIGFDQKESVEKFVYKTNGYDKVKFLKDYAGYDRLAIITKKS